MEEIDEIAEVLFDVGYYDGKEKVKVVTKADLDTMYEKLKGDVLLWCDVLDEEHGTVGQRKRKTQMDKSASLCQDIEDNVETIFHELQSIHGDKFDVCQLRLWGRMLQCGTHDSYTDPPNVHMITGSITKKKKSENINDTLAGDAVAIVKALSPPPNNLPQKSLSTCTNISVGISPGKQCDIRMKNLEQFKSDSRSL